MDDNTLLQIVLPAAVLFVLLILYVAHIYHILWKKLLTPSVKNVRDYVYFRTNPQKIFEDLLRIGRDKRDKLIERLDKPAFSAFSSNRLSEKGIRRLKKAIDERIMYDKLFFEDAALIKHASIKEEWAALTESDFASLKRDFMSNGQMDYLAYYLWTRELGIDVSWIYLYLPLKERQYLYRSLRDKSWQLAQKERQDEKMERDRDHLWTKTWVNKS
ncbi:MAG: hypothetical protein LBR70_01910 [Lactobacillaceae bacterium]|jgi:hypothetical protein|nr:hypothetical protein [Lactobacillaceae bacterium]